MRLPVAGAGGGAPRGEAGPSREEPGAGLRGGAWRPGGAEGKRPARESSEEESWVVVRVRGPKEAWGGGKARKMGSEPVTKAAETDWREAAVYVGTGTPGGAPVAGAGAGIWAPAGGGAKGRRTGTAAGSGTAAAAGVTEGALVG